MMHSKAESTVVVGVALLDATQGGTRVLAARRPAGSPHVGGWELPGGKCRPGESTREAARREICEELGCEVRVVAELDRVVPIDDEMVLRVVVAILAGREPQPLEHDALRWLDREGLDAVRWLAPDVPFLADVRELLGAALRR